MSSHRTRRLTMPRQIAMALARDLTALSLPGIGKRIGGRDHTTVLHAIRKVRHLAATEPELACTIAELRQRLALPPDAVPSATLMASGPIRRLTCPPSPHPDGQCYPIESTDVQSGEVLACTAAHARTQLLTRIEDIKQAITSKAA
jgi:hypothetical protein